MADLVPGLPGLEVLYGNTAYAAGDFNSAAAAYESVLRYRISDPRVEYNLGNAEFRRGNLGKAILHYERARRLAEGRAGLGILCPRFREVRLGIAATARSQAQPRRLHEGDPSDRRLP